MNKKKNPINQYLPNASSIAYGCMGLGGGWNHHSVSNHDVSHAHSVINTALSSGINVFDHADIYTFNKAETAFGKVLKQVPSLRDDMYIQSKCGIRFEDNTAPGRYDFSSEWITHSVDGILQRLNTENIDVLLLHRPDPLMELDELIITLERLRTAGKFTHLGVSNMNLHQMNFLQSALNIPIVANQIELSLAKTDWLDDGVMVGTPSKQPIDFTSGTLEYCRLNKVQVQAWGCLAQGSFSTNGMQSPNQTIRDTSIFVQHLCEHYGVPSEAIVLAFLLRHPANIQPIIGTTNQERIKNAAGATTITLTREEWYTLYVTSRGQPLP